MFSLSDLAVNLKVTTLEKSCFSTVEAHGVIHVFSRRFVASMTNNFLKVHRRLVLLLLIYFSLAYDM